jgi:hypothetical protein
MARRQAVKDYTPLELSERISTSRNTLARWRDLGIGPPFSKLPSGKIVYPGDLFEEYLHEHLQTSTRDNENGDDADDQEQADPAPVTRRYSSRLGRTVLDGGGGS